ncbi:hypothetical protein IB276_18105 [Ensifer sp. ENS04]|nr:hypothetical protein [Ensifer sp. ENS04]
MVLIEHDMRLVMTVSDHIVVLDHGCKIAEGCWHTASNAGSKSGLSLPHGRTLVAGRTLRRDEPLETEKAKQLILRIRAELEVAVPLFEVHGLNVCYGAIHAIRDISLHVNEGKEPDVLDGPSPARHGNLVGAQTYQWCAPSVTVPSSGW